MLNMKTILSIAAFLIIAQCGFCQVPADSLSGEYVGQLFYACPPTNPWTIIQDTVYVSNIDTIYCSASYNSTSSYLHSSGGIFHTTYYSCNSAIPSNYYTLFFNDDSLKMIYDDMIQPPPDPHYSFHFYGKRISNKIVSINEIINKEQILIYPNPVEGMFYIECKMLHEDVQIIITDILGKEIKNEIVQINEKGQVDVSHLKEGIYFVRIQMAAKNFNKIILIKK